MADVLKVTPEELSATANTFKSNQQAMATAYNAMNESVSALTNTWIGEASASFKSQFSALYKNLSQTEEKMADAIDELVKASEAFSAVEAQNKAAADGLDTGSSPFV